MSTVRLESMQTELIRKILSTDDVQILEKVRKMLHREEKKHENNSFVVSEDKESYMTKAEIMDGMAEAFKTAKLAREGKVKGRPIEELLNEL